MNFPPFKKLTAYDESLTSIATTETTMKEPEANPEERFVKPLQQDIAFWKESFGDKTKELAKCAKINGEALEEIKTLRQQLEQNKSEQKQDS